MKGCLFIIISQLMIGLVLSQCKDYGHPTNASYGDLAGKTQYLRYVASDLQKEQNVTRTNDGMIVNIVRIGDTNTYKQTATVVSTSGNANTLLNVYTVDDTTHTLFEKGHPQKYSMISYKPDSYALMYWCIEDPLFSGGSFSARMLYSTNLSNDVSQALEEDKKYNFVNALVELPYNHKDHYENEI